MANLNWSTQQKEKLLSIFEYPKYRDFAPVKNSKSKEENEKFWTDTAKVLNSLKGPFKLPACWRRCWRDSVGYTIKRAKDKARVVPGTEDNAIVEYTMDNPIHDRTMALVGWELADINNMEDYDKENSTDFDPLASAPLPKRKRSLSPLSPFNIYNNENRRDSSPSPSTSAAGSSCNCNCRAYYDRMMKVLEQNTAAIEGLENQIKSSLGNLMVLNVEDQVVDPMLPQIPDGAEENMDAAGSSNLADGFEGFISD